MSNKYVWYLCYGSNLLRDRFYCYIRGGKIEGSSVYEPGCKNKSLPIAESNMEISHRLYFAGHFRKWQNKGCAFIDSHNNDDLKTLCKMYLITSDQFLDIVCQENSLINDCTLNIPEKIPTDGIVLFKNSYYGKILDLGVKDGYDIYTFTSQLGFEKQDINKPSNLYLDVLERGLIETYSCSQMFAKEYFKKRIA